MQDMDCGGVWWGETLDGKEGEEGKGDGASILLGQALQVMGTVITSGATV
jgi:hypothetical protein